MGSFATVAGAGGLGIGTQSGSGTGNAFAGGAASAEDASTVWYNPAGMARLAGTNAAVVMHVIKPSFKFSDRGSTLPVGTGEGGDGGDWALVPQAFISHALNDKLSVGFAFNVPFGLATEYDAGWRGEPIAKKSELKTYNFNLGLAYKLSDTVSIGGGISYQRADLLFNTVPNAAFGVGLSEVSLDDNAFGANIGILFEPAAGTRIGVHYRSAVKYSLTGTISAPVAAGGNGPASATVKTPDSISISFLTSLNPKWELMGDVTWTGWSKLKELRVDRPTGNFTILPFNWTDTWRLSLGANFRVNEAWKLRFGVAYDETPSNDVDRSPKVPDQDRKWVAIGAQYKVSKAGTLDVGYAHEFIKDATVNNARSPLLGGGRLFGQFSNKADIISVQYSHAF